MLVKVINILLAHTYTSDDLVKRVGFLRDYYSCILFKQGAQCSIDTVVSEDVDDYTRHVLEKLVQAFEKEKLAPALVYQALSEVEEQVSRMPTVTLYLPIRLSPEAYEGIGIWFRTNVQPNLLLTVRVDARVAGGCGVVWNNVYHDFSLRYYMRKHRAEIVSMFDRHTTTYAS